MPDQSKISLQKVAIYNCTIIETAGEFCLRRPTRILEFPKISSRTGHLMFEFRSHAATSKLSPIQTSFQSCHKKCLHFTTVNQIAVFLAKATRAAWLDSLAEYPASQFGIPDTLFTGFHKFHNNCLHFRAWITVFHSTAAPDSTPSLWPNTGWSWFGIQESGHTVYWILRLTAIR